MLQGTWRPIWSSDERRQHMAAWERASVRKGGRQDWDKVWVSGFLSHPKGACHQKSAHRFVDGARYVDKIRTRDMSKGSRTPVFIDGFFDEH